MAIFWACFCMQAKRMFSQRGFWVALLLLACMGTCGFVEECMRFSGFDIGALPSAAYGWAWNYDMMQVQSMRIMAYFLVYATAALPAAGMVFTDRSSGAASCVASRCGAVPYVSASAAAAFAGGFVVVFATLGVLQLLSFAVFPLQGSLNGYISVPVYKPVPGASALFPVLADRHPYLNNGLYLVYASVWAGLMALLSFAVSLFIRKALPLALLAPTALSLLVWMVVPKLVDQAEYVTTHFEYVHPGLHTARMMPEMFFYAPAVLLLCAIALIGCALVAKREVLL